MNCRWGWMFVGHFVQRSNVGNTTYVWNLQFTLVEIPVYESSLPQPCLPTGVIWEF